MTDSLLRRQYDEMVSENASLAAQLAASEAARAAAEEQLAEARDQHCEGCCMEVCGLLVAAEQERDAARADHALLADDYRQLQHDADAARQQLAASAERERALRSVLGIAQTDLIQCQQHRSLCVHERDALRVVNDALCDILPDDPCAPAAAVAEEAARE